jgi:hypothetical protein
VDIMSLFRYPKVSQPECLVPVVRELPLTAIYYIESGSIVDMAPGCPSNTVMFIRRQNNGEQYLYTAVLNQVKDYEFGKNEKMLKAKIMGDFTFGTEEREPMARLRVSQKDYKM